MYDLFLMFGSHGLEIFGAITGLLYIWLEIEQKSSMWIVGFLSSLIYVFVYFHAKVYGYTALYIYYMAVSIYGWYCWRYVKQNDNAAAGLQTSRLRIPLASILIVITVSLFTGIAYILVQYTDSPVPYLDALGFSLSIVATWMLARKILEHWILWIFINFFSSALCFSLKLYPTAGLFIVYGTLSIIGWIKWKKNQSFNIENQ